MFVPGFGAKSARCCCWARSSLRATRPGEGDRQTRRHQLHLPSPRRGMLPHSRATASYLAVRTVPAPRQVLIAHSGSPKSVIRSTLLTELPMPSVAFTQARRESARSYRVILPVQAHMPTVRAHRHGSNFRAAQRQPPARSISLISAIIVSGRSISQAQPRRSARSPAAVPRGTPTVRVPPHGLTAWWAWP